MQTQPTMHVRSARLEDQGVLKTILQETFESTWKPVVTAKAGAAFERGDRPADYILARGLNFWVAERSGDLVGFVDWEHDFVNALHVRPMHVRTEVGAGLMDKAEGEILEGGHRAVRLETDTFNQISQAF